MKKFFTISEVKSGVDVTIKGYSTSELIDIGQKMGKKFASIINENNVNKEYMPLKFINAFVSSFFLSTLHYVTDKEKQTELMSIIKDITELSLKHSEEPTEPTTPTLSDEPTTSEEPTPSE